MKSVSYLRKIPDLPSLFVCYGFGKFPTPCRQHGKCACFILDLLVLLLLTPCFMEGNQISYDSPLEIGVVCALDVGISEDLLDFITLLFFVSLNRAASDGTQVLGSNLLGSIDLMQHRQQMTLVEVSIAVDRGSIFAHHHVAHPHPLFAEQSLPLEERAC